MAGCVVEAVAIGLALAILQELSRGFQLDRSGCRESRVRSCASSYKNGVLAALELLKEKTVDLGHGFQAVHPLDLQPIHGGRPSCS